MNKVSYPRNKVLGGIWGLIIGDAVGVPYEFTPKENIPNIDKIDMVAPDYFRKTYIDIHARTLSFGLFAEGFELLLFAGHHNLARRIVIYGENFAVIFT